LGPGPGEVGQTIVFVLCGEMETKLNIFFHGNVHCTALHNKVHDILNESGFAERFERLGHTDLLRLYL